MPDRPLTRAAGRLLALLGSVGLVSAAAGVVVVATDYGDGGIAFLVFLLLPLILLLVGLLTGALLSGRGLRREPWRNRAGALVAAVLLLPVAAWHGLAALDQGLNGSEGIFGDEDRIRGLWRLAAVGVGLSAVALGSLVAVVLLVAAMLRERDRAPGAPTTPTTTPPVTRGARPAALAGWSRSSWPRGAQGIAVSLSALAVAQLVALLATGTTVTLVDTPSGQRQEDVCEALPDLRPTGLVTSLRLRVPAVDGTRVGEARLARGAVGPLGSYARADRDVVVLVREVDVPVDDLAERFPRAVQATGAEEPSRGTFQVGDETVFSGSYGTPDGTVTAVSQVCGGTTYLVLVVPVPVATTGVCAPASRRRACAALVELAGRARPPYSDAVVQVGLRGGRLVARTVTTPELGPPSFRVGDVTGVLVEGGWRQTASSCPDDGFALPCFGEQGPVTVRFARPGHTAVVTLTDGGPSEDGATTVTITRLP